MGNRKERSMSPSEGRTRKTKVSRKWSEEEVQELVAAVNTAMASGCELLNWADIAKSCSGLNRTGKQCREKWRNDLRPDICKEPWGQREEYILARAHSDVGNQWALIAQYLPGRSENSIKNHWNATLRSKAEARTRTFVWAYGQTIIDMAGIPSREAFLQAVQRYKNSGPYEPMESFQVPEDYFLDNLHALDNPPKVLHQILPKPRPSARSSKSGKRSRSSSPDDEDEDDEDEEVYEDETYEDALPARPAKRLAQAMPISAVQTVLAPEMPVPTHQLEPDFLGELGMTTRPDLDAFPSCLPPVLPPQGLCTPGPLMALPEDAAATITIAPNVLLPKFQPEWTEDEMNVLKDIDIGHFSVGMTPSVEKGHPSKGALCCAGLETPFKDNGISDILELLQDVTADTQVSSEDLSEFTEAPCFALPVGATSTLDLSTTLLPPLCGPTSQPDGQLTSPPENLYKASNLYSGLVCRHDTYNIQANQSLSPVPATAFDDHLDLDLPYLPPATNPTGYAAMPFHMGLSIAPYHQSIAPFHGPIAPFHQSSYGAGFYPQL